MLFNIDTSVIVAATKRDFTNVFLNWLKSDAEKLTINWLPSNEIPSTGSMEFTKAFQCIPSYPELVSILQRNSHIGYWNKSTGQILFCDSDYSVLLNSPIPAEFAFFDEIQEAMERKVVDLILADNKESFEKVMTDIRGGKGLSHFTPMEQRWINLSDTYDKQRSLLFYLKAFGWFNIQYHRILAYWLGDGSAIHDAKEDYENAVDKADLMHAIQGFCVEKFCREEYKPSEAAVRARRWASAVKEFVREGKKAGRRIVNLRVRSCDSCGNVKMRYVPWERLTIPWDYYCCWNNDFYDEEIVSISYGGKIIVGIGRE